MQVIHELKDAANEVLIGQAGETQGYTVSTDPALMSMLSTGLYENPHKSMIQETMFNAWDAHKMNGSEDIPIDIYISEDGLIIRDYGPGIPKEDMHLRYCTYGGSDKRDNIFVTGGFGLGCKSPFSYTDSFTVTSNCNGERSVYLISRVSDDVGGKPGMTKVVSCPTKETGLMVTIPLKEGDIRKTLSVVLDLLHLSGIKANIHFRDKEVTLVESEELQENEYRIADGHIRLDGIFAVYGGVTYEIKTNPNYEDNYDALKRFTRLQALYIGFAPNTLTPLPNRENLNMSPQTVQNIKETLEQLITKIKPAFTAVVHAHFDSAFKKTIEIGMSAPFALSKVLCLAVDNCDFPKPKNINLYMWKLVQKVLAKNPGSSSRKFLDGKLLDIVMKHFLVYYPEFSKLTTYILKNPNGLCENMFKPAYSGGVSKQIIAFYNDDFMHRLSAFRKYMEDFSVDARLRQQHETKWTRATSDLPQNVNDHSYRFEFKRQMFCYNTIILSKSQKGLNEYGFNVNSLFTNKEEHKRVYIKQFSYDPILAYVVKPHRGGYDRAKAKLESLDFKVIECNPNPVPTKKVVRVKSTLKALKTSELCWGNTSHGEIINKPTHFLYATNKLITDDRYSRYDLPSIAMLNYVFKEFPNTVIVGNSLTASNLKDRGVIPFKEALRTKLKKLLFNKIRIRSLARFSNIYDHGSIPHSLLKHPNLQKLFSISVTGDADIFWDDVNLLHILTRERYHSTSIMVKKANRVVDEIWEKDPKRKRIEDLCDKSKIFNSRVLSRKWLSCSPKEKDIFAARFVRFLRTN